MGNTLAFVATYLLGGVTLFPLLLTAFLVHAYLTLPQDTSVSTSAASFPHGLQDSEDDNLNIKSGGDLVDLPEKLRGGHHGPDVAAGYFAV